MMMFFDLELLAVNFFHYLLRTTMATHGAVSIQVLGIGETTAAVVAASHFVTTKIMEVGIDHHLVEQVIDIEVEYFEC